MKKFILLGPPGSGKGTIAERITAKFEIPQISTGEIFRREIAQQTEFGKEIEVMVAAGQLVPDEKVIEVVVKILKHETEGHGFMLDGFPRTINQADSLSKHLAEYDDAIDRVLYFNVPREELIKRLAGRRVCQGCRRTYNVNTFPSKIEGKCDDCSGEVIHRDDDKEETVVNRLEIYTERTMPLVEYYKNHGLLVEFDGTRPIEETVDGISKIIES